MGPCTQLQETVAQGTPWASTSPPELWLHQTPLGQICSQGSPMLTPVTYLRGTISTPFALFPLLLAFLVFSNSSHYLGSLLCARHHMRSLILGAEPKALLQPVVAGLTHTSSIRPCASAISVFISS